MIVWRSVIGIAALVIAAAPLHAESQLRTPNFLVHAPNAQLAEQFGRMAEFYRKQKALEWLGSEMPNWTQPCPLYVKPTMSSGGGATTFDYRNGNYSVLSMNIEGSIERMLNSVLPHEVTHTVFAHHFRYPVPRWADEGGAVLSEDDQERGRHDQLCRQYLNNPRTRVGLRKLFNVTEYNQVPDLLAIYAEGYSVADFLVNRGDRPTFLNFVALGMRGNWDQSARSYYGFNTVEQLEEAWLQSLRDVARRPSGNRGTMVAANTEQPGYASAANREVVRLTVPPAQPQLDPAGPTARGTAADDYRARPQVPGVIPLGATPRPAPQQSAAARPVPPPVTLGLPDFAPNGQSVPVRSTGPSPVGFQN